MSGGPFCQVAIREAPALAAGDLLGFVPLARYQDQLVASGGKDRVFDGAAAIELFLDRVPVGNAGADLADDRAWVLVTGLSLVSTMRSAPAAAAPISGRFSRSPPAHSVKTPI